VIVPLLAGGLGNNMFQIATAYAVAKENGTEMCINYKAHAAPCFFHPERYRDNIFKNIKSTDVSFEEVYCEPTFTYTKIPPIDDICIHGCFQSIKYFKKYEKEIKNLFYFPKEVRKKVDTQIKNIKDEIIINHVRRGDYTHTNYHRCTPEGYFIRAQDIIKGEESKPTTNLLITDDIALIRNQFKDNYVHIEGNNEIEDLYLLTRGKYFIGSNSTFSWWGAFLGDYKYKIFPKMWFGDPSAPDPVDIFNDDFICI
tara:strand:- start:395 stop:1159 length:765 start_codon:yes stop_codon:yes gene_type:complete